jgi:hypothetical protein
MTIFVSKTGNDSTGDGTSSNPYLTVGKAIEVSEAGDEISIGDGTYNEALIINKTLSLFSTSEDKALVTLTNSGITVTISPSTHNVSIRNLTIVTTSTVFEAVRISAERSFVVNPSGLPVMETLPENTLIQDCQITFNKTAVAVNSRNGVVKRCNLTQVGATSSWSGFLVYSIDNFSILETTHSIQTAVMNRYIYLTSLGAGDYRLNTLTVKQNVVSTTNVGPGHFILHEIVAHPEEGKFRMDVQHNVFTTTQGSTGGFVILFPAASPTIFQTTMDSGENAGVIANNTVINPYRGWLYVDLASVTPAPMGDTYFKIYDNTFTGTLSQRPNSYDVDGETIALLSTTPVSTEGWSAIYETTEKVVVLSAPTNEEEANDILKDTFLLVYPGENIQTPLTMFSINTEDDPTLINLTITRGSETPLSIINGDFTSSLLLNNANLRFIFQILEAPYQEIDTLSFVFKVYNDLTNELVTSGITAVLEFVLGESNANKIIKLYRYTHPTYTLVDQLTETTTPGTYTYTLTTNGLYSLQIEEEEEPEPEPQPLASNYWFWIALVGLFALLIFLGTRSRNVREALSFAVL